MKIWCFIIIAVAIIIFVAGGYFVYQDIFEQPVAEHEIELNENNETGTTCEAACSKIVPLNTSSPISALDIKNGTYYGNLDQKKKDTPDNWMHMLEGTRSASWYLPKAEDNRECDCDK